MSSSTLSVSSDTTYRATAQMLCQER
jgi:hypothetical protein